MLTSVNSETNGTSQNDKPSLTYFPTSVFLFSLRGHRNFSENSPLKLCLCVYCLLFEGKVRKADKSYFELAAGEGGLNKLIITHLITEIQ